jgi:hypothetical protein
VVDGGASGAAGSTGAGGSACSASNDALDVPDCGFTGTQTREPYTGIVEVTLSGIVFNAPGQPSDAFYGLDPQQPSQSTVPCPQCVVFNRASEGQCVCPSECPGASHRLSDFLVDPYPAFSPDHSYSVRVDLGTVTAQPLNFAFGDCGCADNSGSYSLSIACSP